MATIQKRGGKYQVLVRRKGFPTACRTFHLKSDADQWARYMETKADRGDLPASIKILDSYRLRDILERYRDEVTVKKRGAKFERCVINAFLRLPIAGLTLAQVGTTHFAKYREMRLKTVSPATVNRQLGIIRHAFEVAIKEWGIPMRENPLVCLKRLSVNNSRKRRLYAGEYEAIEQATSSCRNHFILPIIKMALHTGMRRGELLNLRWGDIDTDKRTLFIPLAKNGHSRKIPLSRDALSVLEDVKLTSQSDIVFPISANSVRLSWERLIKRAGINDLHFHDLRHEAISRFFEKGLSVPEVALISGHRDFRMLFRYTHLKAEDIAKKISN